MVKLILGLAEPPTPHDAADALAVAICHAHSSASYRAAALPDGPARGRAVTSWRQYRPARS
jgi:crossover junction endodeoxyribonuclease RuvC